ncbi:CbtB domain-containing protein [Amycolatopsis sp.]|uniref:CbtB domain-containing protein n=1 Tax=Amycolatopsis sp. TaxID=37632 RepID=UPI002B73FF63|nr:CbtB-domain containing protein [Amycolatopsis sp.]HVV09841.1 CbtB-domain containing protein [Amycolatopsis sp.]
MTAIPADSTTATPVVLPVTKAVLWLAGTVFLALALYYFIGVDQGAVSVFGSDTHIHEFVHDARHFLGFPCH